VTPASGGPGGSPRGSEEEASSSGAAESLAELPEVDGAFDRSDAALAAAARDFGRLCQAPPALVLRPASTRDVVRALRWAHTRGWSVAARGAGHCVGGQTLAEGGLVLAMSSLGRILTWGGETEARWVDVEAGIFWRALVEQTVARGLVPPVLTDWLEMTVGGTLSLGGIGAESFRAGLQTDHVLELEVVTGAGDTVVCSPTVHADLFDAVRAGLGQFGIVTRARLGLVPAPKTVTLHQALYADIGAFLADVERLMGAPGIAGLRAHVMANDTDRLRPLYGDERLARDEVRAARGSAGSWLFRLEVTRYHGGAGAEGGESEEHQALDLPFGSIRELGFTSRLSFLEYVNRVPPIVVRDRQQGPAPHPEVVLLIPAERALDFFTETFEQLRPEDVNGALLLVPLERDCVRTPAFRRPESPRFYMFAVLRTAEPATRERIEYLGRRNDDIQERAKVCGGVRYPCDSLSGLTGRDAWQRHFGPVWDGLAEAKRKFDPAGLLGPTLRMFSLASSRGPIGTADESMAARPHSLRRG
jgi:hypothetical protein